MNDDIERQLQAALRPVDPGDRFAQRVLGRIAREPAPAPRFPWLPRSIPGPSRWWAAGLAAMVVVMIGIGDAWQVHRTAQGIEARRQLIEALRVTDEKLDVAYRVINAKPQAPAAANSGA
jgi:hypothetical protein